MEIDQLEPRVVVDGLEHRPGQWVGLRHGLSRGRPEYSFASALRAGGVSERLRLSSSAFRR